MTKIKRAFTLILITMLIAFICMGSTVAPRNAEALPERNTAVNEKVLLSEEENPSTGIEEIAEAFNGYLKSKYGDDYEFYYNHIIEQWGSIETYLLAFGGKLPERHKNSWQKFVGWLGDYASVWAPALALITLIVLSIIVKMQFKKILEKAVEKKIAPIIRELNAQSKASVSVIHAQQKILGNTKFSETVAELEAAEKELKNE